jgi:hypothetical protein
VSDTVSLKQFAEAAGVSTWAAWRAARDGRIPATQPLGKGSTWRVPADFLAKADDNAKDDQTVKHG